MVHAEGLGRRGGRRSRVVRVRKLLAQLQVVQGQPVAVVGNAQAVCGLAKGGDGKVGADPGGQPGACVRVEVAAPSVDRKLSAKRILLTASRASLCAVRAGHPLASSFSLGSFWPRKLSAAPIGVFFKCEALFEALVEHFIPRLQAEDEEETVRFPRRLLAQPVQLLLRQQE